MKIFRKVLLQVCALSACMSTAAFAQAELRDAVDAGDVIAAQNMVKKGEAEEIYCGKLPANDAVKVYEKIFKAMPDESFANCPSQFAYGSCQGLPQCQGDERLYRSDFLPVAGKRKW